MSPRTQNLGNHSRYVPLFHFVLGGLVAANIYRTGRPLLQGITEDKVWAFAMAIAFAILFWYARAFAVAVQNRVIRLEMRLRLKDLLSPPQFARFDQIALGQLVALRFAGDAELPGLVAEVLEGKLVNAGDIKQRIQNWQADWMRA